MSVRIVNLEAGMPTVAVARNRLLQEIKTSRLCGAKVMKIIHGYGSSGRGGAIKTDVLSLLAAKKQEGAIREFCCGSDFSPFSEAARKIVAAEPSLRKDRDYARQNDGITILLL